MQVSDVRIFLSVASLRNLSAAARQLDLAPMQVSRRIAALEEELNARLLHRTTRSVSLTPEGEALVPYATAMLEAEDAAKGELGRSPTHLSGHLKVTAPSVFGQRIVVPLIRELLDLHPQLRVELDMSDQVFDIVGRGFDLAIRIATLRDSELVARKLADNPRVLCASPAYLARHGVPKTLADLEQHNCILLSAVGKWPVVVNGALQRVRVQGHVTTSSVDAVRAAALEGIGIGMLTRWDVRELFASGELVEVELDDAHMEQLAIWAITPTRRFVPARVKVFLDMLERKLLD